MPEQRWSYRWVRLSEVEIAIARHQAAEREMTVAAWIRRLIRESDQAAVSRMSEKTDNSANELDIHLLVAVEQVIALIESFLPEGSGAARRLLPEAVLAAQRRLAAAESTEEEEE